MMLCPTCDHTMEQIAEHNGTVLYRCPRCGTVRGSTPSTRVGGPVHYDDARPRLVDRCREMQAVLSAAIRQSTDAPVAVAVIDVWNRLGIAEAIHCPEEKPT